MKHLFPAIVILIFVQTGFSQNHLVNYYNSFSEVYGGMEDGGISRHEVYYFKVNATITLSDIFFKKQNLVLRKGDTLVINVSKFTPYHRNEPKLDEGQKINEIKHEPTGVVYNVRRINRIYYANVDYQYVWDGVLRYKYKKSNYTVKAKEEFDEGYTGYAP